MAAHDVTDEVNRQLGTRVPGLVVVVVDADRTLLCAAYGQADIAGGVDMTPSTNCNWFSMTKLVTATVAVQLADEGLLDLDAPVADLYTPFAALRPGSRALAVTARHLLSHSAGLANPMPMRWVHLATESGPHRSRFVERVLGRHRRLRFDPGTRAAYSNLGYLVLGEMIEAVSGRPYESCITDRVLEPLGLAATGFADIPGAWATPYQRRRTALNVMLPALLPRRIIGPSTDRFRSLHHFHLDGAAYGGLVGPATEAAVFARVHLGDGAIDGVRLLAPESARVMRTMIAAGSKLRTGLGWYQRGPASDHGHVEHLGGGAGFWNCMRLLPGDGLGVVVMGNASSYDHEAVIAAALHDASI